MSTGEPTTPISTPPSTPPRATVVRTGTPDADTAPASTDIDANATTVTPPRQTLPSSATVERTRMREDTPVRLPPREIGKPPKTPDFRSVLKTSATAKKGNGGGVFGVNANAVPKSAPPGLRSRGFDVSGGSWGSSSHNTTTQGAGAGRPAPSPFMTSIQTRKSEMDTDGPGIADEDVAEKIGVVQWDSSDEEEVRPKSSKTKK
ncbi:hypothetical protein ABW21_db0200027 [Orbilia brochopaga]|nr:hypothetical protein ABW21_db0200027 [Drechslerella brochopaga]